MLRATGEDQQQTRHQENGSSHWVYPWFFKGSILTLALCRGKQKMSRGADLSPAYPGAAEGVSPGNSRGRQTPSFQPRTMAKVSTGPAGSVPPWRAAAARTEGSWQRRKGLVASSSASRDGTVGWWFSRRSRTSTRRRARAGLSGSTRRANRRLPRVYSWAQYTSVSGGSAARRPRDWYICSAVPSNSRPQPPANRVSPQNNRGWGPMSRHT